MANSIFVDTDGLQVVITNITNIQGALETQISTITSVSGNLNTSLTGGAPIITTVEGNFATTMTSLSSANTALQALIVQLGNVQADALAAIAAV